MLKPISIHSIRALVVIDWHEQYLQEFYNVIPKKIASGELKSFEYICSGLENAGQAFVDMLLGMSVGKTVVVLEDA